MFHYITDAFAAIKDLFTKNVWLMLIVGSLVVGIVLYIFSSGEKVAQYKDLRTTVVEQKKSNKEQLQKSIDLFKESELPLIAKIDAEREAKLAELGVD